MTFDPAGVFYPDLNTVTNLIVIMNRCSLHPSVQSDPDKPDASSHSTAVGGAGGGATGHRGCYKHRHTDEKNIYLKS